jgi:hypothetical protein
VQHVGVDQRAVEVDDEGDVHRVYPEQWPRSSCIRLQRERKIF